MYLNCKELFFKYFPWLRELLYVRYPRLRIFCRFAISGILATVLELFVLFLGYGLMHLPIVLATSVAFICSISFSFFLNKYWTFDSHGEDDLMLKQIPLFVLIAFINLNINGTLMHLFVSRWQIYYLLSQIMVAAIISMENYVVYKYLIFHNQHENPIQ